MALLILLGVCSILGSLNALTERMPELRFAEDGRSTNINIRCDLARLGLGLLWMINGRIYDFPNIPKRFEVEGFSSLRIAIATLDLNGTLFQCVYPRLNSPTICGIITELIVIESNRPPLFLEEEGQQRDEFLLDYQHLNVGKEITIIQWFFCAMHCIPTEFQIASYSRENIRRTSNFDSLIPNDVVNTTSTERIMILTSRLNDSMGNPLLWKLSAINASGTNCAESIDREKMSKILYDLKPLNATQMRKAVPAGQTDENFTVCIPIPESGTFFLTMIFPQDDIRDCYVPSVHRNRSCHAGCIQNSAYSISCENSMACFSNLTSAKNVPVYFIRQTKCSSDSIVTCYERVAQFIIEVPGPPNVPMVNYSRNSRTLYFHADSDSEYPVINYIISITDAVGIVMMLNRTSEFVVLDGSTYPLSCEPYNVIVTANNLLGASTPNDTTITTAETNLCDCFKASLKIVYNNNNMLELQCKRNITMNFSFIASSNNTRVKRFNLSCSMILPNLPETYNVYVVHNQHLCKLKEIPRGPPNVPMVSYSRNNRTLYFHADSDSEYPVINYIISITDAVGIVMMLNSTSEFVVLDGSTYPQSCEPYNVIVTANNLLGASTTNDTVTTGETNLCDCFKAFLKIVYNNNNNLLELRCTRNITMNFSFIVSPNNTRVKRFNLSCSESMMLPDLPETYNVYVVHNQQLCKLKEIPRGTKSNMNTIAIAVSITIVAIIIAVAVAVAVAVAICKCGNLRCNQNQHQNGNRQHPNGNDRDPQHQNGNNEGNNDHDPQHLNGNDNVLNRTITETTL